jgi:hypothetical protein
MATERSSIESTLCSLFIAFRKNIALLESKKKYIEALSLVEKMVDVKLKQGKLKTMQVEVGYRIRAANRQAAELLSKGKHNQAIELLRKAKSLAKKLHDNHEKMALKSLIYNSIACVYREKLEVKLAQYYVEKAISLAKLADTTENLSVTYLNGASIYSQAKEHLQAKLYVKSGIEMLNKEIAKLHLTGDISKVNEKKALMAFAYFTLGQEELKLNNNNNAYKNFLLANRLANTNTESLGTLKFKINQEIKNLQKIIKPRAKHIVHIKNPTTKIANTLYSSISTQNLLSSRSNRESIRTMHSAVHRRVYSNYNNLLSANYPSEQTLEDTQKRFTAPSLPDDDICPLMDRTAKIGRRRMRESTPKPFDSLLFKEERVFDNAKLTSKYKQETFDNGLPTTKDKESNEEMKELNELLWSDNDSKSNSIIGNMLNSDKDSDISPLNKDNNWINMENFGTTNGKSKTTERENNKSAIRISTAPTLKKRKGIKIYNSQVNLEPRKYKVIKIHGQHKKNNTNDIKSKEDKQVKLDTHPKISLKLKKEELISEFPETSFNITPMDLNNREQLNATAKPKLEEKKSEVIKSSRGKRISHFLSLTNVHMFTQNDHLQDNYDTEKERLAQLNEKATKIQSMYKLYKEQLQYKQRKKRQYSNRKVLAYRGFYALAKNVSLRTIISIYIVQVTDVELIFTDFKTNDITYRWKGKCDCPLNAGIIKLCWEEIISVSEGNSGNDSKELVKRIQSMKYKDIVFHIEEDLYSEVFNVGMKNEDNDVQKEDLLVSAIMKTNNSINKPLATNISVMDISQQNPSMIEGLDKSKMMTSIHISSKRRYSIAQENSTLRTEMRQQTVVLPKLNQETAQALEIKSNPEDHKTKLTPTVLPVPEEKKDSVLINPNFGHQHAATMLLNQRHRSMVHGRIDLTRSEATNSVISTFSKKSKLKKKQFASASISMASIEEIPTIYDELATAIRIQRWYRAILLWDRINFNPKDIYEVVARRNVKLSVEYKDCSGDQQEVNIRLLYIKKKETETIELIAVDKKTNKRYKSTFMLKKEIPINELNNQVITLII